MPEFDPVLVIEPAGLAWRDLIETSAADAALLLERPLCQWRQELRQEVGVATDRPIIATGHQTLLWHPGILAKYLAVDRCASASGFGRANLVVDQHEGGFDGYDAPIRPAADGLRVRRIRLGVARADVPMMRHAPLAPPAPVMNDTALPSVATGIERIHAAVTQHVGAPHAAAQMAGALADLMARWVTPMPDVTASRLVTTTLGRALLARMVADPETSARAYNDAVRALPEAGITPLAVRDDLVEVPLWRLDDHGQRRRAFDADVAAWIDDDDDAPKLLPRALFMTALVRLGLCDLFVHGVGGANYDRAMVAWIESWLGVTPAPAAVATATLRLPLPEAELPELDPAWAHRVARRVWHDPEGEPARPGPVKQSLLEAIAATPRGSVRRRDAFFVMHRELQTLRAAHVGRVEQTQRQAKDALRRRRERAIAARRDWPFPLYAEEAIDALAERVTDAIG